MNTMMILRSFGLFIALAASSSTARSDSDDLNKALDQWQIAGQNLNNTRSQPQEHKITTANVASLKPKWVFMTGADVSATPTVAGDAVYFPDWAGNLYAVRKADGRMIWSHKISDYDNVSGSIARVSPAIHDDDLIIGDIESSTLAHNGASVMAINRQNGMLKWITRVDKHPATIIRDPL